jgi:hydrogenase maturation protein HypF
MCNECSREYHDPTDRRFDAQGITCSVCGPKMSLYDAKGSLVTTADAFEEAAERLLEGKILAVKGIGGIHLASIVTDEKIVAELRRRKNRPSQPFALMAPDLEAIRGFADPTSEEVQALTSWRRPIVLVRKHGALLADGVAPGLAHVGVMLPYTGIHVMLFKRLEAPALIMTSGNRSGMPMAITNESAMADLKGIADYFLLHNRDIINRCDDSVLRINDGRRAFLRRSRGFVPDPVRIPIKTGVGFAVGTELANAAAVSVNGKCYQTQYLGDITNLETLEYEEKAIYSMRDLLKITRNPDVIGCDQHPGYMTSQLADMISQDTGAPVIKSQHHHAHIVSVCSEKDIAPDEPVIGVALDGAGYGTDGAIWGGEVLISTYSNFDRMGHLENIAMPGGDLCALYPYRFLISALTKVNLDDEEIRDITKNHVLKGLKYGENELEIVLKQARKSSTIKTTSSGRFLDAVSALLELTYRKTYEGEPAMRLESIAINGDPKRIDFKPEIVQKNGKYELLTANTLNYLSKNVKKYKKEDIAAFSQYYLTKGIAEIVNRVAEEQDINKVALSGGVFVNAAITKIIFDELESTLNVLYPSLTPVGDGGSALGQLCIGLNNVM